MGNIAGGITLAVGLWATAPQDQLITWLVVMILFNFARWIAGRRFPKELITDVETRQWERRFLISVVFSGALWGSAGSLFYVQDPPEQGLFLALLIIGMSAAATASLSYHRIAYPAFILPAITPIALCLMSDEKVTAKAIGYVLPFYFTLLYLLSREVYKTTHESILARIDSQYQAMLDHLTGVANRRAFEEAMHREWFRAMRNERALSLIIADIDNFKHCNDRHGHAVGDQVLKAVSEVLESRIQRGADLVARIGGEEFSIVLPETDLDDAIALAESIRVDVDMLSSSYPNAIPKVTISLGVASLLPDNSTNEESLFELADSALYRAKTKGKNRVESMIVQ